jgi:CRP-like cAMP-binding protein
MVKKRVIDGAPVVSSQFKDSAEWCVLREVDLKTVEETAKRSSYDTGDVIFYEGDEVKGVYYVESGLVGVRKADPEGNSTLLKVTQPGDTLGYRPLVANQLHRASAEVLKPSVICFITAKTIRQMIQDTPALGLSFLARAAEELGDAEEKYHESVTLSIRARFAHLLIILQHKFGRTGSDGSLHFTLPISRSDLAAMLGVRRESISRIINELDSRGITKFAERTVVVPDPDSLMREFHKE